MVGGFTLIPVLGLRDLRGTAAAPADARRPAWSAAAWPSWPGHLRELRNYPQTLLFLLAYLFYNDGIQTVITSSSLYGAEQLRFEPEPADRHDPAGAVRGLRRRAAVRPARRAALGAWRVILRQPRRCGLLVVVIGLLPARRARSCCSWRSAVLIGIVLGGSQALSRSLFSQLIPRGREAEYFSLYQAWSAARAGSAPWSSAWCTSSPTPTGWAIVALVVFFVARRRAAAPGATCGRASSTAGNERPRGRLSAGGRACATGHRRCDPSAQVGRDAEHRGPTASLDPLRPAAYVLSLGTTTLGGPSWQNDHFAAPASAP